MSLAPHTAAVPRRSRFRAGSAAAGSVYAYLLDRCGSGREISWQQVRRWSPEEGLLWLVGRPDGEETQRWLRLESGLTPEVVRTLLRSDTRPQCTAEPGDAILLSLRGGGLLPERHSEMMHANVWVDSGRVVVLRAAPAQAFAGIREGLKNGAGPRDSGELLADLIQGWSVRIEQILFAIDREVDDMEDGLLMDPDADLQQELTSLRHRMIHLRRHLIPQAEALSELQRERASWLDSGHRDRIHEEYARIHQYVTELDSSRERAALVQDEIRNSQNKRLNETMKIVAVFTAYLMPVTAITSLLGTNIEGIPMQAGTDHPWGFTIEVIGLLGVMFVSYLVFKKKKWFD